MGRREEPRQSGEARSVLQRGEPYLRRSCADARDDRFAYGEERWITIGAIADIVAIVVVHTDRKGVTRLISARLANRKERQRCHEHLAEPPAGSGRAER
ncbi:BrnT family toxin [Rhizobium sp. CSW-27]|uniref:BrnT family toxin n=1 Tax=Rhizobium sp. CSW-27 TaxID=2839985 RepID=UPI002079192F|nr:BrnT family toxin [Rhizobium sp. CSW-27]